MTRVKEVLSELHSLGIEFVIIGGVAATIHGSTYTTNDLDLCYRRTPKNLDKLASWLQSHKATLRGASSDLPFIPNGKTLQAGLNFTFSTDFGDVDFLGEVQSVGSYDEVIKNSDVIEVFGVPCPVLNLTTLINIKKKIGRPKDTAVAIELEAIKELLEKNRKEDSQQIKE